ncbi:putative methyl-accepting chemotaxis protein [Alicyclobacillus contaminans]|uniref:methyl-accepting chemotaxis protein n=1 Tax=Alicyclobacillus contaminans TaxID=392016 RepID=UPI000415D457|nr:methyl-accepting chemotaxis protein [Alicyclobacillus contaminans]GMA50695.1 putative methyl-accepting chemotaxis protein [Alicyclobacillus contaminans]
MKQGKAQRAVSLKVKLSIAFAGVLILPTVAVGVFSYRTASTNTHQQILQSADQSVAMANQLVEETFTSKEQDIDNLAESVSSLENQTDIFTVLNRYQTTHAGLLNTYVGMSDGQFITAPNHAMPKGYDPRVRPWYQDAVQHAGETVVTPPYQDAITGHMVVTIAKELPQNRGVVAIDVDTSNINQSLSGIKVGTNGYLSIFDAKHEVIASPRLKSGTVLKADWMNQLFAKDSGDLSFVDNGSPEQASFVSNPATGWRIVGFMYQSDIAKASNPVLYEMLTILVIGLIVGGAAAMWMTLHIAKRLRVLGDTAERISAGDLSQLVTVDTADEIGRVGLSFNAMTESLRTMIGTIGQTAEQLAASAEQLMASAEETTRASEGLSSSVQQVAAGTQEHTANTEQTIHAIAGMSEEIQKIAQDGQVVMRSVETATALSEQGTQAVTNAVQKMREIHTQAESLVQIVQELGAHSDSIEHIVGTIRDISRQTHLLSFNAAIEAARAGESGRGFAVVAHEVRKLAERSDAEVKRIAEFVESIQSDIHRAIASTDTSKQAVEEGMEAVHHAGESFGQISLSVGEVAGMIREVSNAVTGMEDDAQSVSVRVNQLGQVAQNIAQSIENVSAISEEQVATMEEVTASASSLADMAESLQMTIAKFKF